MTTTAPPDRQHAEPPTSVADVIRDEAVRTVFQPIVDLVTGEVVAHEALARGPEGPLQSPAALFGAARRAGLLAELDRACSPRRCDRLRSRVRAPAMVFVNVEPEVLDFSSVAALASAAGATSGSGSSSR